KGYQTVIASPRWGIARNKSQDTSQGGGYRPLGRARGGAGANSSRSRVPGSLRHGPPSGAAGSVPARAPRSGRAASTLAGQHRQVLDGAAAPVGDEARLWWRPLQTL